jgi:hypothetical protein
LKSVAFFAVLALLGCSRSRAEIENAPDAGTVGVITEAPRPDGGVPAVADAPLANPQGLACRDRPVQDGCRGADDFPCDFDGWFQNLAEACQRRTECTDGWIEAQVDADGCAIEIRMEDPDPPFVACISQDLSQYRCPCSNVVGSRFLGLGHGECDTRCGTGELRCPPGLTCENGQCVANGADTGG